MRSQTVFLILVLTAGLFLTCQQQVFSGESTLAATIKYVLDHVNNWQKDLDTVHFGILFHELSSSAYDVLINTYDYGDTSAGQVYVDMKGACLLKRVAEGDGFQSATIDNRVKEALRLFTFSDHLPYTFYNDPAWEGDGQRWTLVYDRYMVYAYDWAKAWGINVDRWDKQKAYDEILEVINRPSGAHPSGGYPYLGYDGRDQGWSAGRCRYYDESAESLDLLYKLAGSDGNLWNFINDNFWRDNYYAYATGGDEYECEAGPFALIIGYYYGKQGYSLTNFDRVKLDLQTKFLSDGWSSPLWARPGIVVHASSNAELRLTETLGAVEALHAYSKISSWKSTFANMLTGTGAFTTKAWEGLSREGSVYHDGRFSFNIGAPTDPMTALGAYTLFLEGIIPDSGSLAIPLNEEAYAQHTSMSPAKLFGFDWDSRTIKIPVWAGQLKFCYGSGIASANFPSNGVYQVTFSQDWNTASVQRVSDLSGFQFIAAPGTTPEPTPPPPQRGSIVVSGTYNSQPVSFSAWYYRQSQESAHVTVPLAGYTWSDLSAGTYTVYGSYGSVSRSQTVVVSSSPVPVRFDFGTSSPSKGSFLLRAYSGSEPADCRARYLFTSTGYDSGFFDVPKEGVLCANLEPGSYIVYGTLGQQEVNVSVLVSSGVPKEVSLQFEGKNWLQYLDLRVIFIIGMIGMGVGLFKIARIMKKRKQ